MKNTKKTALFIILPVLSTGVGIILGRIAAKTQSNTLIIEKETVPFQVVVKKTEENPVKPAPAPKTPAKSRETLKSGRLPSKQEEIKAWRKAHPEGSQRQCARDIEASPSTVNKWWNKA